MISETDRAQLRHEILERAMQYARLVHADKPFTANVTPVLSSGQVFGEQEMRFLVDACLGFWPTLGRFNDEFEKKLAKATGTLQALTTTSGSSANLLACTALTSHVLKDRALKPGDEIITCATGFPTTVNPMLQNGFVPVFLDVELGTYNIDVTRLEEAITPRTRAIMVAHTLGNPFNLDVITAVTKKHNLFLIEDCCDALGATYRGKHVGTFGNLSTLSFYPAHHITMGEGGAVLCNSMIFKRIVESIRDWGRDCFCAPGKENTCNRRFDWQLGDLPYGYDHKYTYSHLGYNLKITDMQAALGLAQLERLDGFVAARRHNWQYLRDGLEDLQHVFLMPTATAESDPSWFAFCLTLQPDLPFERHELMIYLNDERKIATRLLFGGNLIRQPYMKDRTYRVVGSLDNSDTVMRQTFWVGVYPGLTNQHLDHVISSIHDFVATRMR